MIEHSFREITDKRIRRSAFSSVEQLIAAVEDFMRKQNDDPKPFIRTAPV
jgi:hypothetical protein